MAKINKLSRPFLLSPDIRKKINKARLFTDVFGLGLVYTFGHLIPQAYQLLLSVYTIMAWVTILSIDPTRLPDAAATKLNQNQAWKYAGKMLPTYVLIFGIVFFYHWNSTGVHFISISLGIGLMINGCMNELYYRNVLQPKIRQLGLPVMASIATQSLAFALQCYILSHSFPFFIGSFVLGVMNGWIVYKTRSIIPNFFSTVIWYLLLVSAL